MSARLHDYHPGEDSAVCHAQPTPAATPLAADSGGEAVPRPAAATSSQANDASAHGGEVGPTTSLAGAEGEADRHHFYDLYRVSRDVLRAWADSGVIPLRDYHDEVARRRLYSGLHNEGDE